jgi:transposase-like protein
MTELAEVGASWEVPQANGQERTSPRTKARATRCVELALQGRTYQQIADELGYANRGTVYRIVQQTLAKHQAESVEFHRDLELARLDSLLETYFPEALAGDLKSAELVLKLSTQRMKLLRLDSTQEKPEMRNTIVVGGTKEEFEAALRAGRMSSPG